MQQAKQMKPCSLARGASHARATQSDCRYPTRRKQASPAEMRRTTHTPRSFIVTIVKPGSYGTHDRKCKQRNANIDGDGRRISPTPGQSLLPFRLVKYRMSGRTQTIRSRKHSVDTSIEDHPDFFDVAQVMCRSSWTSAASGERRARRQQVGISMFNLNRKTAGVREASLY